jgi:ribosome-binding factor A
MKKVNSHTRAKLFADQIHKDVVFILRNKVRDPRLKFITINDVEVTNDYSWATIYWNVLDESKRHDITKALVSCNGFIRSLIAEKFHTYTIPQLKFVFDESLTRGDKILTILSQLPPTND